MLPTKINQKVKLTLNLGIAPVNDSVVVTDAIDLMTMTTWM